MDELIYPRLLVPAAERDPDKIAFIDADGTTVSYASHLHGARQLVSAFARQLDLGAGDRFAVLALNSAEYVQLWHVALLGGGVIVPLNHRLSESELAFIVDDSDARILFVDAAHEALGARIAARCPKVRAVCGLSDATLSPHVRAMAEREPEAAPNVAEDDRVLIMYTGGTTGLPKGAVHTQRTQVLSVYRQLFLFDFLTAPTVFHLAAGLFHVAGVVGGLAVPAAGGTTVVARAFDAGDFIDQVRRYGVTHAGFVVTMLQRVLDHPAFAREHLASLRQLSYGGSPMPQALLDRVRGEFPGVELFNAYGMTEAGLVSVLRGDDHRVGGEVLKSVGRPMVGTEFSIQSDEGLSLARGEIGEICIKTGSALMAYHKRTEETAAALRNGWYRTGDLGRFDDNGYLYLIDRRHDMIISGGENVYPAEVENAIASHPAVQQVAVIGVPDPVWGEAVHAVVVLHDGKVVREDEIIAHARASVAGYKCPKSVTFQSEPLPLSGANKVLKRDLRAAYVAKQRASGN